MEVRVQDRESRAVRSGITDARGAFRLILDRPGAYGIGLKLGEQYVQVAVKGAGEGTTVRLSTGTPSAEKHFSVARKGKITGLVLDEETREPVSGFDVYLYLRRPGDGRPPDQPAPTNSDGLFSFLGVLPGEYVAGTRPPVRKRSAASDTPDPAPDVIEQDYAETFWPGGGDLTSSLPVRLASGGIVDVGTVLVRKVPRYKIRVSIPQGQCVENGYVQLSVQTASGEQVRAPDHFRCGSQVVLGDFDPGSYRLYAASDWQGVHQRIDKAVWGITPVSITDKNQDATIFLQRGVMIEGRITASEGVTLPVQHPGSRRGSRSPEWTGDATFRLAVYPSAQKLRVSSLGGLYVKEIRYNGSPVLDSVIRVNPGAAAHAVEILLDNKWSSLTGTATDGRQPTEAYVALMTLADPSPAEGTLIAVAPAGQFRMPRVPPGEYRIIAVPLAERERLQGPGVRQRLAAAAERITIAPGASQTVTVRLTEIGR